MYDMHKLSLGLTCACNHANGVSGVNDYTFHVGLPRVLNDNSQSLDVLLKMLNVINIHILCLVYTVQPLDNNFITYV